MSPVMRFHLRFQFVVFFFQSIGAFLLELPIPSPIQKFMFLNCYPIGLIWMRVAPQDTPRYSDDQTECKDRKFHF